MSTWAHICSGLRVFFSKQISWNNHTKQGVFMYFPYEKAIIRLGQGYRNCYKITVISTMQTKLDVQV